MFLKVGTGYTFPIASVDSGIKRELLYNSADQPYASIAAQQDAQQRGATEAARRIQLELAAWMANGKKS